MLLEPQYLQHTRTSHHNTRRRTYSCDNADMCKSQADSATTPLHAECSTKTMRRCTAKERAPRRDHRACKHSDSTATRSMRTRAQGHVGRRAPHSRLTRLSPTASQAYTPDTRRCTSRTSRTSRTRRIPSRNVPQNERPIAEQKHQHPLSSTAGCTPQPCSHRRTRERRDTGRYTHAAHSSLAQHSLECCQAAQR